MKLSFHGADRGVTGSCHLVECAGKRVLIDCGLYQGGHELDEENAEPFGFDAAAIDYVLLTHAHLDHCGRLPLLVKRGFRGEIVATSATRELARVRDARLRPSAGGRSQIPGAQDRAARQRGACQQPLYTMLDALNTLDYFGRTAAYDKPIELAPGLRATFLDAGHILGSASIYLQLEENGRSRSVAFSGDLGNSGRPLLRDPVPPPRVDAVVMETTYGDRLHKPLRAVGRGTLSGHRRHLPARRQCHHPDLCAGTRAGAALLPARSHGERPSQQEHAGVSRFAHGDLGHRDFPPPSGVLRSREPLPDSATGATPSCCRACISPARPPTRWISTVSAAAP